jgi:leucyl aminopeptidase
MIHLDSNGEKGLNADIKILTAFQRDIKGSTQLSIDHWQDKTLKEEFLNLKSFKNFKASKDEGLQFSGPLGEVVKVIGLGKKQAYSHEDLRKTIAKIFKSCKAEKIESISFDLSGFHTTKDISLTASLISESIHLSHYQFDKYLSKKNLSTIKSVYLSHFDKKSEGKILKALQSSKHITDSIEVARDFVNEAPNFLHSEEYAKRIEADVKKNLKKVKIKILNKAEIKKEKMNLFLSVNAGSAFEPRIVHLTYEPTKKNAKTKHIALVGKGITFDTGGYSLKPGASMMGMKNDMAGSATVYGAFRAAVLENAPVKITCILVITDNAVSSLATMPDSIITGRNGKTVEILNTDAEGRLILADALDYACDQKPHYIIDAATLTGACLVALGNQVAAILGNDQKWIDYLLKTAKEKDEYMWQLPIINEWRQDIKSKVADIKNIGTPMRAGTAIGAAFLEEFIKNDIKWAHLDIAGVADGQTHLPYCPNHGASGLLIRTLTEAILKLS